MRKLFTLLSALSIALSLQAQKYEMDTLKWEGDASKYINIVFLGDGYTQVELPTFVQDVKNSIQSFFKVVPWKHYANYFNVVLIKTPSNVSGAGLTPSTPVDNFYGTTFGYNGIDRLLWPSSLTKVRTTLNNNFPQHDIVVMIVNSTKYGGAGSSELMTFSKYKNPSNPSSDSEQIFFHEVGHGFANLADEYWAGDSYAYEKPNLTRTADPATVKWHKWVGTDNVGVYPHSENTAWYRPHQNCLMRYLGRPYCDVCRQEIIENIHKQVNPIKEYTPKNNAIIETQADSYELTLSLVEPNPNTLQIEWKKDSELLAKNVKNYRFNLASINIGETADIRAYVSDTTSMLRVDNHGITVHGYVVTWLIKRTGASTGITQNTTQTDIAIGPVPCNDRLTIHCRGQQQAGLHVQLTDISGMRVGSATTDADGRAEINTASLTKGVYIVTVMQHDSVVYTRKITKS